MYTYRSVGVQIHLSVYVSILYIYMFNTPSNISHRFLSPETRLHMKSFIIAVI